MDQSYLRAFEGRCSQEEPPACQTMCPLHVEARHFCKLMAEGKFAEARKTLDRTMPLSGLTGLLCQGACLAHCRRAEVDAAVNLPLLERACVSLTSSAKPMPMPGSGKRIAVAGAGLSSLCCAFELGKRGHKVTVYHTTPVGGRLRELPAATLPEASLNEAVELLGALRVEFEQLPAFSPDWKESALADNLALYLGLDDSSLTLAAVGVKKITDFLTMETEHPKIFAGGLLGGSLEFVPGPVPAPSFIHEAADGKRAAGSITRLLQGVSPQSAREKEGTYATSLYTNLSGVAPAPAVVPADALAPTREEALAEAARCIQCECLECVKNCAYLAHYNGYPKRYAREIYNNLSVVHGQRRANTQIDSCSLCGLCAALCPQKADMGAFCADARREMVITKRMPPSAHEFALEDMAFSNAPDIAFFRHQPGTSASAWAFFPGCQLPASLPEQTERVYAFLRQRLPANDGKGVGFFLHCCGAPARWSGRDILTQSSAAALRKEWETAGKPALILACASCLAFFTAELSDIPALSLWDVLADLPLPAEAKAARQELALHDPCAARGTPAVRTSVRKLAADLGQRIEELPLGRELTRCCGYGGLADAANPDIGKAMAQSRGGDTDNALLTWCIMCRDRLAATGKPALHLLDLLFAGESPEAAAIRPAPGISQRQETRRDFRRRLLKTLWNEDSPLDTRMDDITLHMSEETERKLEERRILHADIKAVLLHAGQKGPQFVKPDSGRCLSSLRPKQVTFWVEYTKEEDGCYTIHNAYCHRMVVPGSPGDGLPTAATLEGCAPKGGRM